MGHVGSVPAHRRSDQNRGGGEKGAPEDMCVDSLEFRHYELVLAAGDGGGTGGGGLLLDGLRMKVTF